MSVLLLLAAVASAQPFRPVEAARVPVGPGATVSKMPAARVGFVELQVRNGKTDLARLLSGRGSREIRRMDAVQSGGGSWLVRVEMVDPAWSLDARIDEGALVIEVVPERIEVLRLGAPIPTVEDLLSGDLPPEPPPDVPPPLCFLRGSAMAEAIEPWGYEPVLLGPPDWMAEVGWETIDRERHSLLGPEAEVGQASLRLGMTYLAMGMIPEARYYLSQVDPLDPSLPQADVALGLARAELSAGRWEEARSALARARAAGAPAEPVIEGLAMLSLGTGSPPPAPTARALAAATGRQEALALAVELLQRDGRLVASLPILEAIARGEPGEGSEATRRRVALRHGDALYISGDSAAAVRAWEGAPADLAAVRRIMADLVLASPADWGRRVPDLVQLAAARTDAGADALYLVGQIDQERGEGEDAISEYALFIRQYPRAALASDVPERFWTVYHERVLALAEAERWFDLASLHESLWREEARRAVADPRALLPVARAYEEVGLTEEAIPVLRDAIGALLGRAEEDADLVLRLAEMYAATGQWADGLATLHWLDRPGMPEVDRGRVLGLRARLHARNGQVDAAAADLRALALVPERREEAAVLLAVLDAEAGRCTRALPALERVLFGPGGDERWQDSAPWLALARCLTAAGRGEGAARAAREAAGRAASPEEARYATWLAAVAGGWENGEVVDALVSGDDIWARMAEEQRQAADFRAEIGARARGR